MTSPPPKRWKPLLTPKGEHVFNSHKRILLVDGPRKSSKTLSCLHKVCRRLYDHPGTIEGIIAKTTKNAKAGAWRDLINIIIPQWIEANIGFQYVKEPSMAIDTKMTSFRIRSRNGQPSECQLHSLEYSKDAEDKFKSTRFGGLYLSEADLWESRDIFDVLEDQLRMPHMRYEDHQFIVDCNPPEEGDDHWLWELFFEQGGVEVPEPEKTEYQRKFHRIQIKLEDNTLIDPREIQGLKDKYAHDKNKTDRWVNGLWVRSNLSTLFKEVWRPNVHVVGTAKGPRSAWEVIIPDGESDELFSGWDLGETNHAFTVSHRRAGETGNVWEVIDELVSIGSRVSIAAFTAQVLEIMDYWESVMKGEFGIDKVRWRHWSDSSAFRYRSAADSYDELIVSEASEGRIMLHGVAKGRRSVSNRVSIARKLLFQNRLLVSANCRHVIQMFNHLPPGNPDKPDSTIDSEAVDSKSQHKHIFDALTYLIGNEEPLGVVKRMNPKVGRIVTFA